MKKTLFAASVLALIFNTACKNDKKPTGDTEKAKVEVEEVKEEPKHWSYDGETNPEHWEEIEKEADCGGQHQSPIDIITADVVSELSHLKSSDVHYHKSTTIHDVTNNGHSIQYNFDKKENFVNYKGKRFDLIQFHFHAASEHTIDGMHYPLVAHMVHVSEDKQYLVFAVMVKEGEHNSTFEFLETYLPLQPGETKTIGEEHSFAGYMFENFEHYHYTGSLTTPPCTEEVNWFVFKNAITASPTQVKMLEKLMPRNNFRPTQPLNGRKVYLSE